MHYFGVWAEPESALALYLDQRDDLHAGRVPRVRRSEGFELRELMNRFTAAKEASVKVGGAGPATPQGVRGDLRLPGQGVGQEPPRGRYQA